jgi:hypothetical protein
MCDTVAMVDVIDEYTSALPDDRAEAIRAVDELIRTELAGLDVTLWGNIIGYGSYHYRYASGREGEWFPVGLANQKAHLSLYVCLLDGDQYLAEQRKDSLGKVNVGRSCVRFKRFADLDVGGVRSMLQRTRELLDSRTALFGQ